MAITLFGAIALPLWFSEFNEIKVKGTVDTAAAFNDDVRENSRITANETNIFVADDCSMNGQEELVAQNSDIANDNQQAIVTKVEKIDDKTGESPQDNTVSVNDQYVQQQIDANRELISEKDLEIGAPVFNKIDMDVVYALADDGFTEDEKTELRNYLKTVFTEEEYTMASGLFYKYVGLVE